jgi:hypothetical protein
MDECEGSLYNILRDERVRQRSQQGGVGRGEGGRQIIFCLDNVTLHIHPCNNNNF